jgi:uncharacterized hydrophobic protein (TIGR00271 family)
LGPLLYRYGVTRLRLTEEQRTTIEERLYDRARIGGPSTRNFLVLSILSSTISALGLLLDSAPAVIGAMLLGPFIVPLLAIAGALVQGWGGRFVRALAMTAVGILLSVGTALVVGWVVGANLSTGNLPSQLAAIAQPGLLDLAIALAAGVAAGYATLRTEAGGALSGVAVSVTIEPPLAAIGLFLAAGNHPAMRQAMLAMVTNFGALVVGATISMAWWGFADRGTRLPVARARLRWALAVWVLVLAIVAVPLTLYSRRVVDDQRFEDVVTATVADWDPSVHISSVDAKVRGDIATVALSLSGPRPPEPAWRLAEMLSEERGVKVTVDVTFVLATEDHAIATP